MAQTSEIVHSNLFFEINPEIYSLIGLDKAYNFFYERFSLLNEKKRKNEQYGGTFFLSGPIGGGKSFIINQLMKDCPDLTTITITVNRGAVIFELIDELVTQLDLILKKERSFLKRLKRGDVVDVMWDVLEELDPTPVGIFTKTIKLGTTRVVKVVRRGKKKVPTTVQITTSGKHTEKQAVLIEKLTLLAKIKPFVIFIENLQWIEMDDAIVLGEVHKETTGKLPIVIVGRKDDDQWTQKEGIGDPLNDSAAYLAQKWDEEENDIRIQNMNEKMLRDWLLYLFPNSDITDDFFNGFYTLTQGNLRYVINALQYLNLNNFIDYNDSLNIADWQLPKDWSGNIPDSLINLEKSQLMKLIGGETEKQKILEKAAVVAYPFKAFEVDILERVLREHEVLELAEILDFSIQNELINPIGYRIEFPREIVHACFYENLGRSVKSELHFQTAKQIEEKIEEESFKLKRINRIFQELAIHYENAANSFSESRSREAEEKAFEYYIRAGMGMFGEGATQEAREMLANALANLAFNPIDMFNILSEELEALSEQENFEENGLLEFLLDKLFPSYMTLLAVLEIYEIRRIAKNDFEFEDFEELLEIILKEYEHGILNSVNALFNLFDKVRNYEKFLEELSPILSPIAFMLQSLLSDPDAPRRKERLDLIYKEFVSISEFFIQGFDLADDMINQAYFWNLLAYFSNEIDLDPKPYASECGNAYLKAADLPIEDIIIKSRLVRNAGWNYLSAGELENSINAFQIAKALLTNANLDHDYVRLRTAEFDLRSFQMILVHIRNDPFIISDRLIVEFTKYLLQFWEPYGKNHQNSNYPQYLSKLLESYSEHFGKEFFEKLNNLAEPILVSKPSKGSKNILIVTNEWDYWLADLVHDKLTSEDPSLSITFADPEEYAKAKEKIKPDTIIVFGGPKAPHIGSLVTSLFQGETNFRFLTWRHPEGFGGVWSKERDGILYILIAGNDEETADGTLLFIKHQNKWEAGYHLSILKGYFKH